MKTVKCPECGHEIHPNKDNSCPYCGFILETKGKSSKKISLVLSILLIIILIIIAIVFVYHRKTTPIENEIQTFIEKQEIPSFKVAKEHFNELSNFEKMFVKNRTALDSPKIELTNDNFRDYFDIDLNVHNLKRDVLEDPTGNLYAHVCKCDLTITPLYDFKCEDCIIDFDLNINPFVNCFIRFTIEEDGTYFDTYELQTLYQASPEPIIPRYNENNIIIEDCYGKVIIE